MSQYNILADIYIDRNTHTPSRLHNWNDDYYWKRYFDTDKKCILMPSTNSLQVTPHISLVNLPNNSLWPKRQRILFWSPQEKQKA